VEEDEIQRCPWCDVALETYNLAEHPMAPFGEQQIYCSWNCIRKDAWSAGIILEEDEDGEQKADG
jgi:hypothetical protein